VVGVTIEKNLLKVAWRLKHPFKDAQQVIGSTILMGKIINATKLKLKLLIL